MKRIIIKEPPRRLWIRIGWFVGIWAASVAALGVVAYALHKIILG
jgi:hypothetical protein